MIEDAELLRRYAAERSQDAFAELVRRRVNLVYSVALRQVGGDAHLAEDVTQRVFADLARKANTLCERAVLSGWLYRSAQFAATDVVRGERRRRAREQEVHTMNEIATEPTAAVDWEKIRPVLDEVTGEMDDDDRDAVALRFFEERSFAEVGAALRLNEEAARKRVTRALDKLHALLSRRGVTSTTAALGLALASQGTAAAPAGLAASIASGVVAGGLGGAGTAAAFMSMNKIGVAAAILIAGGTAGVLWQQQKIPPLQREIEALRPQVQQAGRLRAENERLTQTASEVAALRAEHEELVRLRGEVADLKKELSRPRPTVASASAPAADSAGHPIVSMASLNNVGRATPRAAGQTLAWALQNGETDVVASLVTFEPEARKKMEELVAILPEPARSRYSTPEQLLALAAAGGSRLVGVQLIGEEEVGPDDATQRVQFLYRNGKLRTDDLHFHRDADGWKQVITMASATRIETALHEKLESADPANAAARTSAP